MLSFFHNIFFVLAELEMSLNYWILQVQIGGRYECWRPLFVHVCNCDWASKNVSEVHVHVHVTKRFIPVYHKIHRNQSHVHVHVHCTCTMMISVLLIHIPQATQHDLFISFILVLLLSYTALCKCYHNHDIIKNCDYLSSTIMIPKNHNRLALWTATGNVSMWNTVYGKFELQYSHTCMSKSKYTSRCQVHVVIIITINLQQCIIHDIIIYYPTI